MMGQCLNQLKLIEEKGKEVFGKRKRSKDTALLGFSIADSIAMVASILSNVMTLILVTTDTSTMSTIAYGCWACITVSFAGLFYILSF